MTTVLLILIAVFIDYWLGEPRRWHPLAGFGRLAVFVEARLYGARQPPKFYLLTAGVIACIMLIAPLVVLTWWLSLIPGLGEMIAAIILYLALGINSLFHHARTVAHALKQNQLVIAREKVAMMVSRDTNAMQEVDVTRATIESVLENGCDAIFGALFWFIVLGAPGVVLYRLANTLDAMWGYRNERYIYFGWSAARLDDLLNWIPARFTALSYIIVGHTRSGWQSWQQQATQWSGVNPGVVMASGAGALKITLGGPAQYHGEIKQRPVLGKGEVPVVNDIERSIRFVQRSLWLWLIIIFLGGWLFA